ncbi:MAG: DUF3109 family protein [Ginsengibacter sp.]
MIGIGNVLISDEIVEEQFVCDLHKCKGGCCVDGDAGAPLENKELKDLNEVYEIVEPYLTEEGKKQIEKAGRYIYDTEFGWVTPVISNGMCAYGTIDQQGIVKCGIEQAFNDGRINWKKPISCHLFPIRIKKTKKTDLVNYEPREGLCDPACVLGQQLKMPVYQFLKEPLIRKYGDEFYQALEATAQHLQSEK